jgi:hypothetical protein
MGFRRYFRTENNLGQTLAVSQVNKNKTAVVASVLNPSHEAHMLPVVATAQNAASVAAAPAVQILYELPVIALQV